MCLRCLRPGHPTQRLLALSGGAKSGQAASVATRLIHKLAESESADSATSNGLTPQEWKVLGLLASGSRNKEIANRLSVSENTVKTHLYTIYRKIKVDCRLAATLYYFQHVKSNGEYSHKPAAPRAKVKKKENVRTGQGENSPPE